MIRNFFVMNNRNISVFKYFLYLLIELTLFGVTFFNILGWGKSNFGFFHVFQSEKPKLLFAQLNIYFKLNFFIIIAFFFVFMESLKQASFFVETCENFEFFIFFRILLVQVKENYTKNNDLQYFLFQIKIANAILHADEVLQRRGALRDSL